MTIKDDSTPPDGIAMAPLIDVVFLLLIFFLVSTTLKSEDKEIELELPEMENTTRVKKEMTEFLIIAVDPGGIIYLDGEEANREYLRQYLKEIAETEPDKRIRLDADRSAPFRSVAEVLDLIKVLDLQNFGIKAYEEEDDE